MAGSFDHVVDKTPDGWKYRGTNLLENMGDMSEAVEQMAFMLVYLSKRWGGQQIVDELQEHYRKCCRGELAWPDWFQRDNDDAED